jgi:hypothetical protein
MESRLEDFRKELSKFPSRAFIMLKLLKAERVMNKKLN